MANILQRIGATLAGLSGGSLKTTAKGLVSARVLWPGDDGPPGTWQRGLDGRSGGHELSAFSAVYACVSVLSQDVAKLPLRVWRKGPNGARVPVSIKERDRASFVAYMLYKPNSYQTLPDFLQQYVASLLLKGNAYAFVTRNNAAMPDQMRVLHPDMAFPWVTPDGDVFYNLSPDPLTLPEMESQSLVPQRFILHSRHQTFQHPLMGISPLHAAAYSASTGLNIMRQSESFFRRMARPSGILQSPKMMDGDVAQRLSQQWSEIYGTNPSNAGRVAVLEDGMEWKPMTMTAADSQLIEQLRFTVEDVARVYRVPIFMLGDMTKASYRNSEVLMRNYYAGSLSYLCKIIEERFNVFFDLGEDFELRFDLDDLFRAESDTRINTLKNAVQGGILTPNEARAKEGYGPVDGGQHAYVQQQMVPLSVAAQAKALSATPAAPMPQPEDDEGDTGDGAGENSDTEDETDDEAVTSARAIARSVDEALAVERLIAAVESELRFGALGGENGGTSL